jgi:CysZ protein
MELQEGLMAVPRGLGLIARRPSLWPFVLIPLVINIGLFSLGIWLAGDYFGAWVDQLMAALPGWLAWLYWVLWILFAVAAALIVFLAFNLIANLIAAPFNVVLADAVAKKLTGKPLGDDGGIGRALREIPAALRDELRKLLYFLVRAIPLALLFLIPGVNVAAPFIWLLFSAWILSIEYLDYPMGNAGLTFREQRRQLAARRTLALGFGGGVLIGTMIPLLNLIVMPSAVAGATRLWVERMAVAEKTAG